MFAGPRRSSKKSGSANSLSNDDESGDGGLGGVSDGGLIPIPDHYLLDDHEGAVSDDDDAGDGGGEDDDLDYEDIDAGEDVTHIDGKKKNERWFRGVANLSDVF